MEELLKIGIPCMVYSQIWLNLPIITLAASQNSKIKH
jgi:hypothetical protein